MKRSSEVIGALLITVLALTLTSIRLPPKTEIREDYKKFYDQHQVEGSFVLYDQKRGKYVVYNQNQASEPFTPASTFKILNSLIALETGVVQDEKVIFKWDKNERSVPAWNADSDMRDAFKNSTVWYYQELARRTGSKQMQYWLDKAKYGNAAISGGIDQFWLQGGLRISPRQQVDFLRRLQDNKLPFAQRNLDTVKKMMIAEETLDHVLRRKTGLGEQDGRYIGWYVGYITTKDNTVYFANCIQSEKNSPDFVKARLDIANQILQELEVID